MKLIKTRLRGCLKDSSLSSLIKIVMETTGKLTDSELKGIWNRKLEELLFNIFCLANFIRQFCLTCKLSPQTSLIFPSATIFISMKNKIDF